MKMHIISSGSKGNASFIYDKETTILIDFGISLRRLKAGLKEIDKTIDDIDYCLCTHNHSDHSKSIKYLKNKDWYCRKGTISNFVNPHELEVFNRYLFGEIVVTPLLTSHDAIAPCGFLFEENDETIVYITDTGYIPEETLSFIKNCDYYFFESNYDEDMLKNSDRSQYLKYRILSEKGHLSNVRSAEYLSKLIGDKTKAIMLAHISQECNTKELALKTCENILKKNNVNINKIIISCASQWNSEDLC